MDKDKYKQLCDGFAVVYTTTQVLDMKEGCLMGIAALRVAFGSGVVTKWLHSDCRQLVMPEQVRFGHSLLTGHELSAIKEALMEPVLNDNYDHLGSKADFDKAFDVAYARVESIANGLTGALTRDERTIIEKALMQLLHNTATSPAVGSIEYDAAVTRINRIANGWVWL